MDGDVKQEEQTTSKNSLGMIVVVVVALAIAGGGFMWYMGQKSGSTAGVTDSTVAEQVSTAPTAMQTEEKKPVGMEPQEPPQMTEEQTQQAQDGMDTMKTEKKFTVNGGNFYFVPNVIKVNKGDTVTVEFKNDGGMHDFVIDEFAARTTVIQTDGTDSVTFVADRAGSFEFYCSVGQHRANGMKGMLIVQ